PGGNVLDAMDAMDLAVLTVGSEGALVTSLKPSNEREKESLGRVVTSLGSVLKGKSKSVEVPPDLSEFLKGFATKPLHPVTKGGFQGKLDSRIFSIKGLFGDGYVVLEQAADGVVVNLFPVAGQTVK